MRQMLTPDPFEQSGGVSVSAALRIQDARVLESDGWQPLDGVTVNGRWIPRADWATTVLRPGDQLGLVARSTVLTETMRTPPNRFPRDTRGVARDKHGFAH